ncbi:major facilitator superfamily domain-containing protein [Hypoxylon argillaceum]|nr:major facilitator superfamily domain-containing protein [Hypoxylon argillaceum]
MATAGQYGFGYTAVPPTAAEQDPSTAADVPNEKRYASHHQDTTGWGYENSRGAGASTQMIEYAAEGQWQHQGHVNNGGYVQYDQAAGASNQMTQWSQQQYYYNQSNGVAVPQAVYYGQEGWTYNGNSIQYWDHNSIGQPRNDISPGGAAGQYMRQQNIQYTTQGYGQEGSGGVLVDNQNALMSPSPQGHSNEWQRENKLIDPVILESHPRKFLTPWHWRLMLIASNILSFVNGYDVSNIANIQGPIYEVFGDIHLLPWLALSYSVCNVVATPLARKLYKFYDIKVLTVSGLVLLIVGNGLAGGAPNLVLLIIGRAVMAFGASIVYQGVLSFSVIFSYPGEISLVHASFGASFAFGILTGPVIGAGFTQNLHTTWRWSFYFSLPILTIALFLCLFTLPSYSPPTKKSVSTHFKEIDWIGHILHSGTFISFGLATVFSGSAWPWGSVPQLVVWVIFVTVAVSYVVQQTFSIGIKPEQRILPIHLLKKRIVLSTTLCTFGAAITYGVTFYYTPLFYAFIREMDPLEAGLRLLSFTAFFISAIFISHAVLPLARYYMPFFLFGGALLLAGGISWHTVTSRTPLGAVMAFSALLGAGVGVLWNLAIPVCSAVLETQEDRLDQTTLHSIAQLGGTALSLSISAAIYWNIGLKNVREAAHFTGFADTDILALLSGAESKMLDGFSPDVRKLVIDAIITTISQLYFIVIAGAALCFIAALFLRIEPLRFKRWIKTRDTGKGVDESQKEKATVYELR